MYYGSYLKLAMIAAHTWGSVAADKTISAQLCGSCDALRSSAAQLWADVTREDGPEALSTLRDTEASSRVVFTSQLNGFPQRLVFTV